jgi:DNA-binding response OmpR family regulator
MKKILFIEDSDEIRENTAEILELANYVVYTAANGKEGIEIALQQHPDLVICDILMPVLDGYGVLHSLNKHPEFKNTPFIFLTAKSERADIRKGMELGADDYIVKPFSGTELLSAVETRLKKREQAGEGFLNSVAPGSATEKSRRGSDAIRELTENSNINRYKKKQIIYSEGNRPSKLFCLKKGKVKIFKTNDDGKELVMGLYKEGDYFRVCFAAGRNEL